MSSSLMTHRGSVRVTKQELYNIPVPPSTDTFRPVKHSDLVNLLGDLLRSRGLTITKEEYAVQKQGNLLFGVLDFSWEESDVHTASLGLRTPNDKSFALHLVAGGRVTVCDNLLMAGSSIIIKRKHTKGLNLPDELTRGLDKYQDSMYALNRQIEKWRGTPLTDDEAKALMMDMFKTGTLPLKLFHPITSDAFKDELITLWSIHNSATSAFKSLPPSTQFTYTMKLGRYLDARDFGDENPFAC
jgi:Domain of unknown function (DUF932)